MPKVQVTPAAKESTVLPIHHRTLEDFAEKTLGTKVVIVNSLGNPGDYTYECVSELTVKEVEKDSNASKPRIKAFLNVVKQMHILTPLLPDGSLPVDTRFVPKKWKLVEEGFLNGKLIEKPSNTNYGINWVKNEICDPEETVIRIHGLEIPIGTEEMLEAIGGKLGDRWNNTLRKLTGSQPNIQELAGATLENEHIKNLTPGEITQILKNPPYKFTDQMLMLIALKAQGWHKTCSNPFIISSTNTQTGAGGGSSSSTGSTVQGTGGFVLDELPLPMDQPIIKELLKKLALSVSSTGQIKLILSMSGVPQGSINFNNGATLIWMDSLTAAREKEKIYPLIKNIKEQVPALTGFLDTARQVRMP
jgi:hypothetical protein